MTARHLCTAAVLLLCLSPVALAQHSDIEFSYAGGMIDIEFGPEGQVFEADLPTSGLFEQISADPGFASESVEGLGILPNDLIDYNVLGPLMYHNGTTFAPVPAGAHIDILDVPSGGMTVDDTTVGPVSGGGVIGQADGAGEFHSHVDFELQPLGLGAPEYGAYGILMDISTDEPGIDNSDPFFVVFNFGLDEPVFEGAVEAFAAVVPEPASLALALSGGALLAVGVWRRRRRPATA